MTEHSEWYCEFHLLNLEVTLFESPILVSFWKYIFISSSSEAYFK